MYDDLLFIMPVLETERLILRKLELKDSWDIFEYGRDPQVARHVLWDAYTSEYEARRYIRYQQHKYRLREPASWGIVFKETGKVIGTIGYMEYSEQNSTVEVGYSLAKEYWNRGIMTEALRKVIDYTFVELGINRIEAQFETTNPASGKVMAKCFMKYEGTMRQRLFNKGKYVDVSVYAILRKDTRIETI